MKLFKAERGTTMIEMMIAVGILTTMSLAVMSAMSYYAKTIEHTRTVQQRDKRIQALLENFRSNLSYYQANYTHVTADAMAALDPATLPYAWSQSTLVPAAECPACPGKLGYVIYASDGLPGMFKVVVRVTHSELYKDADPTKIGYRDFQFVVNAK